MTYKLAIIGGGAAGFFCVANIVEQIAPEKLQIDIYERLNSPMLKLLASGGGRCNITHYIEDIRRFAAFYPRGEKFLFSVFNAFSCLDMLEWFKKHQIETYVDLNGCVFPQSESAKSIQNKLLDIAKVPNVFMKLGCLIHTISYSNNKFNISMDGDVSTYDFVLIATGGQCSIKKQIKDNFGYQLATSLGHSIEPVIQVLSSIRIINSNIRDLAGISLERVALKVKFNKKIIAETSGDLLFTHQGISGPVVMNLTSYLYNTRYIDDQAYKIVINWGLFSDLTQVKQAVDDVFSKNLNKDLQNVLKAFLPKALICFILNYLNIDPAQKVHSVNKADRMKIIENLFEFELCGFQVEHENGIVSAGGVSLKEVDSKTMMSKILPNLYFAGEILDVDGLCGGFNLQFAWSSAYIAASSIIGLCK